MPGKESQSLQKALALPLSVSQQWDPHHSDQGQGIQTQALFLGMQSVHVECITVLSFI